MGVQIAEMAGGLAFLAIELLAIWATAEIACWIFFSWRERKGKEETTDYCKDCGTVEWLCICE